MFNPGDVVVATVQLADSKEMRTRAAVVLFEEYDSVAIAGITSNPYEKGIAVTKKEGAVRDGVIKLNYLFTVPRESLSAPLFRLSREKKKLVFDDLVKLLSGLQ